MKNTIIVQLVWVFRFIVIITIFFLLTATCFGQNLNSAEELKEFLKKQPANRPDEPIKVTMILNDLMFPKIVDVIKSSDKYVNLNISGNALTAIPDFAFNPYFANSYNLYHFDFFERKKEEVTEELVSITIPDSVTSIGRGAFEYCIVEIY